MFAIGAGGSLAIDTAGDLAPTGVTLVTSPHSAAEFTVTGQPGAGYAITLPASVTLASGANNIIVQYLVNGGRARTVAGSRGGKVIAFLQPDVPVEITLDMSTVEDAFMVPMQEGCRVTPRGGVVSSCSFTMTTGGEVDGIVSAQRQQGDSVPLKGVRVDLLRAAGDGVKLHASTLSQESGYYLFKAVKPGDYLIVIPDQELARLDAAPAQPLRVAMPDGGDMISGQDFLLQRAAARPTLEAAAGRKPE